MKQLPKKSLPAFTMLELVFVIVVLGILAALALQRIDRDIRQEAADNILSAIRYTQHLALIDNRIDPNDQYWQKTLWKIEFTSGSNSYYTVSSDKNKDGIVQKTETAIDPSNNKYLYHLNLNPVQNDESPNVALGIKYGIDTITGSGGCANTKEIAFGINGRVFNGINTATNDYSTYMSNECNLTFEFSGGQNSLIITILPETGYAYIDGQEDS